MTITLTIGQIIAYTIFIIYECFFGYWTIQNILSFTKDCDDLGIFGTWISGLFMALGIAIFGGIFWW